VIGRRLVILVVVLMGLTALAASVSPPPETRRGDGAQTTPTPSPAPTASDAASAQEGTLTLDGAERAQEVRAVVGQELTLEVRADTPDTVVIDGLDATEPVAPDSPAHFDLYADAAGRYPVRLLEGGRELGELVISSDR
jgi:hypothetical protein